MSGNGTPSDRGSTGDEVEHSNSEDVGDNASDERSLFGEKREATTLFVGSDLGITRVSVAAAQVGQFSLVERCSVKTIAADAGLVVAGTDESVLVSTGEGFESVGFGPAVAVGVDGSWLYAAGQDGRLSRLDRGQLAAGVSPEWEPLGHAAGPRQFDGNLLASGAGVFRVELPPDALGLADVRDVGAGPFAATDAGLYHYDGEWTLEQRGDATAVVADGDSAHAIVDGQLWERADGEWQNRELPGGREPRLLAYCETLSVLSADGTLSVQADPETSHDGHGGWRSQALGLGDPTGLAALE